MTEKYFDFQKDTRREGRVLFAREWDYIIDNIKKYRSYEFNNENIPHFDLELARTDGEFQPVELKLDRYPYTGNIVIELVGSIKLYELPIEININSRMIDVAEEAHPLMVDFLKNTEFKSKGLGFKNDRDIPDNHLFHTIFVDKNDDINEETKIVKQVIFKTVDVIKYISFNFDKHTILVTRSRNKNRYWATISTVMPLNLLTTKAMNFYSESDFLNE